jgi:uncharacterized protein (TIGR02246 family)
MRHLLALPAVCLLAAGCSHAPSKAKIEGLGTAWGEALTSRNPETITALYDQDAVLLATFTNVVEGEDAIRAYFEGLTKNDALTVRFQEQDIKVFGPSGASNTGTYTFSFNDASGNPVSVPARYSFVYEKIGGEWQIVSHHSSKNPETAAK